MDKKIGILTFHYAHNYGAVMQAFALRRTLINAGYCANIVDYRNDKIVEHYPPNIKISIGKRDVFLPYNWFQFLRKCIYGNYAEKSWSLQYYKFEMFINEYLLKEDKAISNFDVLICGSDQVWGGEKGPTCRLDDNYFLSRYSCVKKIAYAASNYTGHIETDELDYFKKALQEFDLITTREQSFATSVEKELCYKAYTVVDPVFLLYNSDYSMLGDKSNWNKTGYVLAYYLEENRTIRNIARKIAKLLGKKLIELHYFIQFNCPIGNQVADAGPEDFLKIIEGSDFVVTNSYHGVAFSVIFHKQFYAVYEKDARKDNLLNVLNINDRHIISTGSVNLVKKIDYNKVEILRAVEVEKSKELLFGHIEHE